MDTDEFSSDRTLVLSSLNALRYGRASLVDSSVRGRLGRFVECVLASAPNWQVGEGTDLCRIAGETAELLSADSSMPATEVRWLRLRAALLYELGQAPAVASTILHNADLPDSILGFFRRDGPFAELNGYDTVAEVPPADDFSIEWSAVDWDVRRAAGYVQRSREEFGDLGGVAMSNLARSLALPLFATDYQAFAAVVRRRLAVATRTKVPDEVVEALRRVSFPSELWAAQVEALEAGMLSDDLRSWGIAAPTGTGKSFLTQVLIADSLLKRPEGLVLYLVPSRALVHEVSGRLSESLSTLDASVTAVTPRASRTGRGRGRSNCGLVGTCPHTRKGGLAGAPERRVVSKEPGW